MARRMSLRSLHRLAEAIYDELEDDGYFRDDDRRSPRRGSSRTRSGTQRSLRLPAKPKRKVSAYQREFGRQLKKLKKAHPRTPVTRLMKRAHAATRRARRGK